MHVLIAPVPCMTILTHLQLHSGWIKLCSDAPQYSSDLACPLKNTKFNLISYIAKCTLELASKETPMSSRAFCKGIHFKNLSSIVCFHITIDITIEHH